MTGVGQDLWNPGGDFDGDWSLRRQVVKAESADTCPVWNQNCVIVLTGPEALFWNVFRKIPSRWYTSVTLVCMEKVLPQMYIDLMP